MTHEPTGRGEDVLTAGEVEANPGPTDQASQGATFMTEQRSEGFVPLGLPLGAHLGPVGQPGQAEVLMAVDQPTGFAPQGQPASGVPLMPLPPLPPMPVPCAFARLALSWLRTWTH